jgi:hypothetical protein
MPRVFGLHEVELPEGMATEEYVQRFGRELASLPNYPGWKTYLLRGDRGDRAGKLLLLFEVESVEARDRYFPRPDEESEEARRFDEQHRDASAVWEKYGAFLLKPHSWTDYVVVNE